VTNNGQYENNRSPPEAEIFQFISGPNISNIPNMKKTFFSPSFTEKISNAVHKIIWMLLCALWKKKKTYWQTMNLTNL